MKAVNLHEFPAACISLVTNCLLRAISFSQNVFIFSTIVIEFTTNITTYINVILWLVLFLTLRNIMNELYKLYIQHPHDIIINILTGYGWIIRENFRHKQKHLRTLPRRRTDTARRTRFGSQQTPRARVLLIVQYARRYPNFTYKTNCHTPPTRYARPLSSRSSHPLPVARSVAVVVSCVYMALSAKLSAVPAQTPRPWAD